VTITHIIILLASGVVAGFSSGLLGLGGAFIMTPVQYMVFTGMGIPEEIAIRLAFGTSLLAVLPTVASGAWRHDRMGAVWWKAALVMGSFSLVFAFAGATLAAHLPGVWLRIAFGALILASAIRMLTARETQLEAKPRDNPWLWVAMAVPVGFISGIFGIGGGIMMVPVMVLAFRFRMHTAIATSLAVMIFTSTGGVIGYIISGLGVPNLPPYSIGYVNLPAWFLLVITSAGMAQLGTITAHKLPAKQLGYVFVAILFYMGLKMVGVFDWLGLPL
jgi:uncharacterized membrane protein YfcA